MNDMRFFFPVAAGTQGNRTFYTACVPFGMLSRLMAIDTGNVMDRSQRQVDTKRATAISKYICENMESFVLPALTGVIEDDTLEFTPASKDAPVGELSISMDANIKLFDGQHRATGILEALNSRRAELKNQQITIQLFVNMSLEDRQQAFSDINSNAKAVSVSLNMTYNKRNNAVAALAEQIEKVAAWNGNIDHENNIAKRGIFSFRHAIQASRILLGIGPKQIPDPLVINCVSTWWNTIAPALYWNIQERRDNGESYDNVIRKKIEGSIAFTAAGLMTLARVYRLLNEKHGNNLPLWKCKYALENIDWHKSSDMWQGNLVDEKGNMTSGTAGQIAAAELIAECVSAYCEAM